jgi:ribosomal protein S20
MLSEVTSLLDRAAQDNLIHVNKANRIKAKLAPLATTTKSKRKA